ncbi:MAG: Aspartate-semialdehyde dehydrogenase [Chlamydiae bacterium]|nr:Aspartate-semialdehyde dehydrogenase [Chlamydiota bacterium]
MYKKIPVGLLGATGLVGQHYLKLLKNHPRFELVFQPARERIDAFAQAKKCRLLFSALPTDVAKDIEVEYARRGFPIFTSAACHRLDDDVPLIIPEINAHHLDMIALQQKNRGWESGFIVAKPNCTLQSYLLPLYPLHRRFKLERLSVTNLQAISGAGAHYKLNKNIIPYIPNEEEKSESEPLKILGEWDGRTLHPPSLTISSHCIRVPVQHGHLACISASFKERPSLEEIVQIWREFKGLDLPSAPKQPLHYFEESDRPQPLLDHLCGEGMSVAIGRLRECPLFDIRFTALSHNLIRGAAGGGLLTAELYIEREHETFKEL